MINKRRFNDPNREQNYRGYTHQETNRLAWSNNAENARQYVFERITNTQNIDGPPVRTTGIYNIWVSYFDDMKTDEETDTDKEPEEHPVSNQTDDSEKK